MRTERRRERRGDDEDEMREREDVGVEERGEGGR